METQSKITGTMDTTSSKLKERLSMLYSISEFVFEEIYRSYELLKVGEKTELSKTIEDTIENPIDNLIKISALFDNQIINLSNAIVVKFLNENSSLIHAVYKIQGESNELHYFIILKNDNYENRTKLFGFFDSYNQFEFSSKCAVYFQFVPVSLAEKITNGVQITLDNK